MRIGVVLAGGEHTRQAIPPVLRDEETFASALLVAADSGLDLAERIGFVPHLVVGDFDSVTPEALDRARARGVEIVEYPTGKDETDLELALRAAIAREVDRILVMGGGGGRLDHLLANVSAIAAPELPVPVEAWMGEQYVTVLDAATTSAAPPTWRAELPPGATVSVLAWGADAVVSETGLRWPLDRHLVAVGSTLGVSNEALGGPAEITVHQGRAVVILPVSKVLS
ncbi:MAG: thiamine diphosphokinase [Acidimicrobiales bacterium]